MDYLGIDKNFSLKGKVSLITGGAKGIGKSIAQLLSEKGSDIILVDKDEKVKEVVNEIKKNKIQVFPLVYDLLITKNINLIVKQCINRFKKIDILVNNVGYGPLEKAENVSEESWNKTIALNLTTPFLLSQAIGKEMIKRNYGKIINIASQAGIIALDKHVSYCCSKAALISMTRVLALEWAKYNINVNSISPTVTLTELGRQIWAGKVGEDMKKKIPVGRFVYPDEVAIVALFLASNNSNMITGENIVIDGGYTIT